MSIYLDYNKYLLTKLNTLIENFENDKDKAHLILTSISAGGSISEVMYKLYTSTLKVNKIELYSLTALYMKNNLFELLCDCEEVNSRCLVQSMQLDVNYHIILPAKEIEEIQKEILDLKESIGL